MELKYFYNAPRVRQTLGVFSFVKTPMADFGKARGSFILPFLDVESVSERLVDGVYSTRSSSIYMPGLVNLVTAVVCIALSRISSLYASQPVHT